MRRILFVLILAAMWIGAYGCAREAPDEVLAPNANGLSASELARPDKTPLIQITLPVPTGLNPAEVPPLFYVTWIAQDIKSVRWILVDTNRFGGSWTLTEQYIQDNPDAPDWSDWTKYRPDKEQGMMYESPPMAYGTYVFAVEAKSPPHDQTALVLGVNMARLLVSQRVTGPIFKVYNRYIGSIVTASPNTPAVMIDVPSGTPMSFRLSADASAYGAIVSGYRYGWDIVDPEDDSQWEIDFTPFVRECGVPPIPCADTDSRAFYSGTHTFWTEVIDCWGYKSRVAVQIGIVPVTMTRPLLVVDDWKENSPGWEATNGGVPSDEEHDQFWLEMTTGVEGFDPSTDVFEANSGSIPPLDLLLTYKSIIWSGAAAYNAALPSAAGELLRFIDPDYAVYGRITPNFIALYMAAGGHVLLCGEQIMTASINRETFAPYNPVFPLIFRYELGGDQTAPYPKPGGRLEGVGDESFAYEDCCLDVLDIAYISNRLSIRRDGTHTCPVNTVRPAPQSGLNDGLRTALPMSDRFDFPALTLRPEAASPGKWFADDRLGLNCDIYNPPYFENVCSEYIEYWRRDSCFDPIYGNGCLNTSSKIYGAPVAFWTSVYEDRVPDPGGGIAARSAVWGFHPVYFNPAQVESALEIVLFDEWQLIRKAPPPSSESARAE